MNMDVAGFHFGGMYEDIGLTVITENTVISTPKMTKMQLEPYSYQLHCFFAVLTHSCNAWSFLLFLKYSPYSTVCRESPKYAFNSSGVLLSK